jgi:class 3 adenylate cyclase
VQQTVGRCQVQTNAAQHAAFTGCSVASALGASACRDDEVLHAYPGALGRLIHKYEAKLDRFAGDGVMVAFNDPISTGPVRGPPTHGAKLRATVATLPAKWGREGHELCLGVGIAHAALGRIGLRVAPRLRGRGHRCEPGSTPLQPRARRRDLD